MLSESPAESPVTPAPRMVLFEPAETESVEAYGIGPDDYYRKDNPAKISEIANRIEVETQPLAPEPIKEVYKSNEQITLS